MPFKKVSHARKRPGSPGKLQEPHLVRATVVGDRGQIVIPKEIRDRAGLKPGSRLMVMHHQARGPVILLPMEHMRDFMEQMVKHMKEAFE